MIYAVGKIAHSVDFTCLILAPDHEGWKSIKAGDLTL